MSRIPYIYSMSITNPTISAGGTLNVQVEAEKTIDTSLKSSFILLKLIGMKKIFILLGILFPCKQHFLKI